MLYDRQETFRPAFCFLILQRLYAVPVRSPEIYSRPGDRLDDFDTIYACGPDDYDVPIPDPSDEVAVGEKS